MRKGLTKDDCCFKVEIPDGYHVFTSGTCAYIKEENVVVAPFGCEIINNSSLPDNFGVRAYFNPLQGLRNV